MASSSFSPLRYQRTLQACQSIAPDAYKKEEEEEEEEEKEEEGEEEEERKDSRKLERWFSGFSIIRASVCDPVLDPTCRHSSPVIAPEPQKPQGDQKPRQCQD
nr:unnamed protein product [Spirometra erinaceieuropaei]